MLLIASTSVLLPFPLSPCSSSPPRTSPFHCCSVAFHAGNRIRDACSASCSLACRVIGTPNNGSFRPGSSWSESNVHRRAQIRNGEKEENGRDRWWWLFGFLRFRRLAGEFSRIAGWERKREGERGIKRGEKLHRNLYLFVYPRWIPRFRARANVYSRA